MTKIEKLKELFSAYQEGSEEAEKDLRKALFSLAKQMLYKSRGRREQQLRSTPLADYKWFNEEVEEEFKLYFAEQVFLWLDNKPNFSEIDLNKEINIQAYDSFKNNSWYYKVLMKIADHCLYAFKKKHKLPKEIAKKLKRKYHIPEPVITKGKTDAWQSMGAKFRARCQEMKMIRKLEGQKDLERELRVANDEAIYFAEKKLSEVQEYIDANSHRLVWNYMLRHPEDPLWYLLAVIEPEEFEYFFLCMMTLELDLGFPKKEVFKEAIIREEISELKRRLPHLTYTIIAEHISKEYLPEGEVMTDERVAYLHRKDKDCFSIRVKRRLGNGEEEVEDNETIWSNKILRFALHFSFLRSKEKELKKVIAKSKHEKEFTDSPEAPASYFAQEDLEESEND